MAERCHIPARDSLHEALRAGIEYALTYYGGEPNKWRSAKLGDLLDEVMTHVRAGIGPHLGRSAVEDGAAVARDILREQFTKHGIAHCPDCVWTDDRHSATCARSGGAS